MLMKLLFLLVDQLRASLEENGRHGGILRGSFGNERPMNVIINAATYFMRALTCECRGDVHPELVMEFHSFISERPLGLVELVETGTLLLMGPRLAGAAHQRRRLARSARLPWSFPRYGLSGPHRRTAGG